MNHIIQQIMIEMDTVRSLSKIRKEECIQKWIESGNFPRKKKKKVRKRLLMQFEIFSIGETLFSI